MEAAEEKARCHVFISGIVQGVGFRFFTMEAAWKYELTGWVRNRLNGDVEVVAEGKKAALDAFIEELKEGPPSAKVDDVKIEWLPYQGEFTKFNPRETI